jgi:pyrroline-5-carboxylate reductase
VSHIRLALIGAGNIGVPIALGLVDSGLYRADEIILTRRTTRLLEPMRERGYRVEADNRSAIRDAPLVLLAVEPQQADSVLAELGPVLDPERHVLISIVTGVSTTYIRSRITDGIPVVRAMPNTAVAVRESMTCLASDTANGDAMEAARSVFDALGTTLVIKEEQMNAATALVACGIAFFLRAIRAASQGGIEIGFHSSEALAMAAQTAKGSAAILLGKENHPEQEIDRVTTPRGCTIAGLNHMEHEGFSSALIKGICVSAEQASRLHSGD